MRTLKIFYHDNCFDGTASAAVFSDFYRKHIVADVDIGYQGVHHINGDPFAELAIDGDDNACLDFRYCDSDKMTWWFDHHVSAFQPPAKRSHFDADDSGQKFYDPTSSSCTKFLVQVLEDKYGYELPPHMNELVRWADIIDSAQFGDPKVAVSLDRPATEIMTWIRHNKDAPSMHRYIREIVYRPLEELAQEPWIREPLEPLVVQHQENIQLIRRRAVCAGGVVFVDLSSDGVGTYNSFISYYLFPEARYTVGVVRDDSVVRITAGHNPWSGHSRHHNIAAICERFGGGGHPFVGGVTLPVDLLERGRKIARAIRDELME
ncbi:phosphoesterase [Haliangium sp.]|uniref:phosphoesterase n=1 Tax=Haliangium sp. TaxID=2663208 RepID=UPI003D09A55A